MKTTAVNLSEAKARLSHYGKLAERGETTIVLKHHRTAFAIAPLPSHMAGRPKFPGLARGQIHLAPDFDITPDEIIMDFEGAP